MTTALYLAKMHEDELIFIDTDDISNYSAILIGETGVQTSPNINDTLFEYYRH